MLLEFPFKYFVSHAFFHLTLTKFQQKKIDEVTDERIVYTFGVQHHAFTKKKKICFNGFHVLAKTIIRSGYIFCFFWLITQHNITIMRGCGLCLDLDYPKKFRKKYKCTSILCATVDITVEFISNLIKNIKIYIKPAGFICRILKNSLIKP